MTTHRPSRIMMVVNAEWYFLSHRLSLARALRARGHHVTVAAGVERGKAAAIEAEGFQFYPLPIVRGRVSVVAELQTGLSLARLYRRVRPDLLYHTTIKPILYGSLIARATGPMAVVNAIPGLGHVFSGVTRWELWRERVVGVAYASALRGDHHRAIFQNVDDRDLFVSRRLVREDSAVVIRGSGVNLSEFVGSPLPDAGGDPILVLASRLLWQKGVAEFVDAVRRVKAAGIRCRAVIVGVPDLDSPDHVPAAALTSWEHEGLIEWWGLRADMPYVLAQASVVVLPSYYREGVPKILLEACASARAVVTTDMPGCREAVQDGKTGILVPPRDIEALASALTRLLSDRRLMAEMGRNGRRLAEEEFDEATVVAAAVSVMESLLLLDVPA